MYYQRYDESVSQHVKIESDYNCYYILYALQMNSLNFDLSQVKIRL